MKHKSITFIYSFENPNTPAEFESILRHLLIGRLLASLRQADTMAEVDGKDSR